MTDSDLQATPAPSRASLWGLWFAILYALSPIDLIPDALPVAGLFDDVGVTGTALLLALNAWRQGHLVRDAALPVVLAAIYAALPVDVVPDVVPGLGRVDDLVVAVIAAVTSWWLGRRAGPDSAADR